MSSTRNIGRARSTSKARAILGEPNAGMDNTMGSQPSNSQARENTSSQRPARSPTFSLTSQLPIAVPYPTTSDKPLPILPTTTVLSSSPSRRSPMDNSDRLLHRSATSPDTGDVREEGKPEFAHATRRRQVVSSELTQSIIDAIKGVSGQQLQKQVEPSPEEIETTMQVAMNLKEIRKGRKSLSKDSAPLAGGARQTASGQSLEPSKPNQATVSPHKQSPSYMQVNSSPLQFESVVGKKAMELPARRVPDSQHSWDNTSESLHAVTAAKTSGKSKVSESSILKSIDPFYDPADELYQSFTPKSTKPTNPFSDSARFGSRESFIPKSTPSIHQFAKARESRNFSMPFEVKELETLKPLKYEGPKYSQESPQVGQNTAAELPRPSGLERDNRLTAQHSSPKYTAQEFLALAGTQEEKSYFSSDTSDESVQCYDAVGGYREKRVRNTRQGGLTIRIDDSADRLLLGDETKQDVKQSAKGALKRKQTAINLRGTAPMRQRPERSREPLQQPSTFATNPPQSSSEVRQDSQDLESLMREIEAPGGDYFSIPIPRSSAKPLPLKSGTDASHFATTGGVKDEQASAVNFRHETTKGVTNSNSSPIGPGSDPIVRPRNRPSKIARPSTIVHHAKPDEKTAPFLYQHVAEQKVNEQVHRHESSPVTAPTSRLGSTSDSANVPSNTNYQEADPSHTVKSPEQSDHEKPSKHWGLNLTLLRHPKGVKTFSQSISPRTASKVTQSTGGHRISVSNGTKAMVNNVRGLFRKTTLPTERRPIGPPSDVRPWTGSHESGDQYPLRRHALSKPDTPITPFTPRQPNSPSSLRPTKSTPSLAGDAPESLPSVQALTDLAQAFTAAALAEPDINSKVNLLTMANATRKVVSLARGIETRVDIADGHMARVHSDRLQFRDEVRALEVSLRRTWLENGSHN